MEGKSQTGGDSINNATDNTSGTSNAEDWQRVEGVLYAGETRMAQANLEKRRSGASEDGEAKTRKERLSRSFGRSTLRGAEFLHGGKIQSGGMQEEAQPIEAEPVAVETPASYDDDAWDPDEYLDLIPAKDKETKIEQIVEQQEQQEKELSEKDQKMLEELRAKVEEQFKKSLDFVSGVRDIREDTAYKLSIERKKISREKHQEDAGGSKIGNSSDETALYSYQAKRCERILDKVATSTPEGFVAERGLELYEHLDEMWASSGGVATTPYVREKIDEVTEYIDGGRPVCIEGHLGAGKTELAVMAATEYQLELLAHNQTMRDLNEWSRSNPNATREEVQAYICDRHREHLKAVKQDYKNGSESTRKCRPILFSANRETMPQDMLVDKTLSAVHNGENPAEVEKEIESYVQKWIEEQGGEDRVSGSKIAEVRRIYTEIITSKSGVATEVQESCNAVAQAILEGRVVIIDEANMLRPEVATTLNDIMTKRPGDMVQIPGFSGGPVRIPKGFSIILTANPGYAGTLEGNAATASRADAIAYDYLPMHNQEGTLASRIESGEGAAGDELFQVMIMYLVNKSDGSLELRDMDATLEKLWNLALLANQTQQIFSGKRDVSKFNHSEGDLKLQKFEHSVLSIRNIKAVLDKWNKGDDMDLDTALWRAFIDGMGKYPREQHTILALAKALGFFQTKNGWELEGKLDTTKGARLFEEDIHVGRNKVYNPGKMEYRSLRETLEVIYGKAPSRKDWPEMDLSVFEGKKDDNTLKRELKNRFKRENEKGEAVYDPMEYLKYCESRIKESNDMMDAMEVLSDARGCNVNEGKEE